MSNKSSGKQRTSMFDLIRTLMQRPRTMSQLLDMVEMTSPCLSQNLKIMESCGLVYVDQPGDGKGHAGRLKVYHWCPVPFDVPPTVEAGSAVRLVA